jgi:hypothetical protein
MSRLSALLACLAAVALTCSGCFGRGDEVRLRFAGQPNQVAEGDAHVRAGMPVSVGGISLCLTRRGRVTIDKVTLVGPLGGVRVDGWTLVNHPGQATSMFIGADHHTLASYGFPLTHTADMVCREDSDVAHLDELVVQVERTDESNAGFHAMRVDWSSQDDHGTLDVPLAIALCNGDADAADCHSLGVM